MDPSTVRPISAEGLQCATAAPPGVRYAGARAEGSFLVLRFQDERAREERDNDMVTTLVLYVDRWFDGQGKEVMRESGELVESIKHEPNGLWAWLWAGVLKLIS